METDEGDIARTGERRPARLQFGIRRRARVVSWTFITVIAVSLIVVDVSDIVAPRINLVVRIVYFAVVSIVGVPFVVWLKRRMVDATVSADSSGLYIYNGFRTRVVAWREIEGFEPSSRPFLLVVKRTGGRPIPMAGITPETFGRRGPQREDMRELEAYWRRMVAREARATMDRGEDP